MDLTLRSAVGAFGAETRAKLSNAAAYGEPEDQLRAPLERLFGDLAELAGVKRSAVVLVGESSLADLKTRPDYAVTVHGALVGFIEVKAPGKGGNPSRFKDKHDAEQWKKLQALPNLLYTDGNEWSLWRSGEREGEVVRLHGDVETSGSALDAPPALLALVDAFLQWEPQAPRSARQLAQTAARLCKLLRDEVTEQLARQNPAFAALATDWRKLLFPEASDGQFADGYAQAVTFGMLMARAQNIELRDGLDRAAKRLGQTSSLIGKALQLLTDDAQNQDAVKTSLGTLTRVLDAVEWSAISRGEPDAWLYFYEDFLDVYDRALRRQTGSYYTPPAVVNAMVRLTDEALRSPERFGQHAGLASPAVMVADPAVGTGTFLLGVLRRIAETVKEEQGAGAVPAQVVAAATKRLLGFELQLGPFAVAQLRLLAEVADLAGSPLAGSLRLFVTDTLGNPYAEQEWIPATYAPIAESRRQANAIKVNEPITVVIGNPPYKEKAMGRGGWVEQGGLNQTAPLNDWMPPAAWGVGAHAKHLRNLYVYFWRWATWKVWDHDPLADTGIVCFITVAGFLTGPGFERMRDYLRRRATEVWVIDCTPEGHQPEVPTRIFEGVQQPVCIVLACRAPGAASDDTPARVRFRALPAGPRADKMAALGGVTLDGDGWTDCPSDWRAPFRPASAGAWATYPELDALFVYNGSGVMPGRTWVIAPDADSLLRRWQRLTTAPAAEQERLFHPHLAGGGLGDRHMNRVVPKGLPGFEGRPVSVAADKGPYVPPIRYGFRSFDRQWIIPDNRLINRPNPNLWESHSAKQVYLTALMEVVPTTGPAVTFTGLIPDLHHYKGSFGGRAFPLWQDRAATVPNVAPGVLSHLAETLGTTVTPEDVMAYLAAVAAHPAYVERFRDDLATPGLRVPLTADPEVWADAVRLGREVLWLHTFGERYADPAAGRPTAPPRAAATPEGAPTIPAAGALPTTPDAMPDEIGYDPARRRLLVGSGYVENVAPAVWEYEVSGKKVLRQWFSYRKKDRERPLIGDKRPPSPLGDIQPDAWPAEYTTELLDLLHVLTRLVALEPAQAALLERVCSGPTIPADDLPAPAAASPAAPGAGKRPKRPAADPAQGTLLD
jgi:hypothetical protein